MMKHPATLAATFAVGFGMAWIAKPNVAPPIPAGTVIETRAKRTGVDIARPGRSHGDPEADAALDKLLEDSPTHHTRNPQPDAINEGDYSKLLEALAKRAGMTGLDSAEERLMEKLVLQWHETNSEAALNWVLGLKSEKDTCKLLSEIIGNFSEKDFDKAIAFAEQYGSSQGRELDMPYNLRHQLGKLDAKEFVRVLGLFTSTSGSSGGNVDFANDFDFREALDGLAGLRDQMESGTQLEFTPTNLLSEWAKHDFDSALAWARSGKEVSFNSIKEVFSAAGATASTDDLAGMVVQLMQEPHQEPEQKYRAVWSILADRPSPELVASFLQQLPGDRQEHLSQMLATSLSGSGSSYDAFKEILLAQMTAGERIAAFQSEAVTKRGYGRDPRFFSPILLRLGHTEQEINQMLPAVSQE